MNEYFTQSKIFCSYLKKKSLTTWPFSINLYWHLNSPKGSGKRWQGCNTKESLGKVGDLPRQLSVRWPVKKSSWMKTKAHQTDRVTMQAASDSSTWVSVVPSFCYMTAITTDLVLKLQFYLVRRFLLILLCLYLHIIKLLHEEEIERWNSIYSIN